MIQDISRSLKTILSMVATHLSSDTKDSFYFSEISGLFEVYKQTRVASLPENL